MIDQEHKIKTLILSTVDAEGGPHASYAPFIYHSSKFYIFVSNLARHTENLRRTQIVDVLLIEDESESKNLFARKRVNLRCTAHIVERDDAQFAERIAEFRQKFGPVVSTLESLPDFYMFELHPLSGRQVTGFGQATDI